MKRIIKHSMFLVLMLFSTVSFAQVEQTNADTYFYYSKVENAKLILYASSETFANLSQEQKTYILADKLQNTNYDEIVIYTNYGRELWFRKNGTLTLADSWDMNSINIEKYAPPVWRGNTQKNFFVSGNPLITIFTECTCCITYCKTGCICLFMICCSHMIC